MKSLIFLGAIILYGIAGCLFFDDSRYAYACEQGESGQSDAGQSDAGSSGVADSAQSSTSGDDSQQGMGSQNAASSHEGNGGESAKLINCSDPFWWGLVPCKRVSPD